MQEPTGTLELVSDEAMNLQATEPVDPQEPRGRSMNFTYASGARPLEGYTIKRGIGQGGFGEVYYATSDGGKEVALKLVRRNMSIEIRGVKQCLNLKHPNLIDLYDIKHDDNDNTWVVMEYVAGQCMDETVEQHPDGMSEDDALRWMHGVCAGVAYLHDRGIVHRDLKPGNIFCDEGIVKIGDYGLSKFISASRRSGQTESVGTVHYMAPEVANGRYGKEIDIYALGIMLYEVITGRVPFEGESIGEVLMKHLTAQPDLSELKEPYQSIVRNALEKDPEKRLKSVNDLIAALPPAPAGTVTAVPHGRVDETMAWSPNAGGATAETTEHHVAGGDPPISTAAAMGGVAAARRPMEYTDPFFRFVTGGVSRAWNAWLYSRLGVVPKMIVLIIGVLVLITLSSAVLPLLIVAGVFYSLYLICWVVLFGGSPPPAAVKEPPPPKQPAANRESPPPISFVAAAKPPGTPPGDRHHRRRRKRRHGSAHERRTLREQSLAELKSKPARDKVTELLGSMILAALVAAASTAVLGLVFPEQRIEDYVWVLLVGTLGAWAILIPSKTWEANHGERVLRGLVLLAAGLLVGVAAFGITQGLQVNLSNDDDLAAGSLQAYEWMSFDGTLAYGTHLAYFGFLLALPRWWRIAHPLRKTRLSVGAVVLAVLWAWGLSLFWEYPQPWGMVVAAIISVSVQLSSPWIDTRPRWTREVA